MEQLSDNKPKLSIITVVFNAENTLEKTIRSVAALTYPNYEYIIIDGKSTDNTLPIIRRYENIVTRWISEPDNGLYDAMNKGIHLAGGDYLWFMNAGDEVYKADVADKIFSISRDADFYYGETMLTENDGKEIGTRSEHTSQRLPEKLNWKSFKQGLVVGHQSVIVKKSVAPLYNTNYRYSADIDWIIRCLKNSKKVVNSQMVISSFLSNPVLGKFRAGGESKTHLYRSLLERFRILKNHYGLTPTLFNHMLILWKAVLFFLKRLF